MKFVLLLSLVVQTTYVLAMPAPDSSKPQQVDTPDSLEARGKCWYDNNTRGPACSSSGWCSRECDENNPGGKWCAGRPANLGMVRKLVVATMTTIGTRTEALDVPKGCASGDDSLDVSAIGETLDVGGMSRISTLMEVEMKL